MEHTRKLDQSSNGYSAVFPDLRMLPSRISYFNIFCPEISRASITILLQAQTPGPRDAEGLVQGHTAWIACSAPSHTRMPRACRKATLSQPHGPLLGPRSQSFRCASICLETVPALWGSRVMKRCAASREGLGGVGGPGEETWV